MALQMLLSQKQPDYGSFPAKEWLSQSLQSGPHLGPDSKSIGVSGNRNWTATSFFLLFGVYKDTEKRPVAFLACAWTCQSVLQASLSRKLLKQQVPALLLSGGGGALGFFSDFLPVY